jgi:hypothetical protein
MPYKLKIVYGDYGVNGGEEENKVLSSGHYCLIVLMRDLQWCSICNTYLTSACLRRGLCFLMVLDQPLSYGQRALA